MARYASDEEDANEFFTCVLPILVVSDHTLWVVGYSEEGVPDEPVEVTTTNLFVDRKYESDFGASCTLSHLNIYTRSEIARLLKHISTPGPLWESVFPRATIQSAMEEA
jgi:hypothetical protein